MRHPSSTEAHPLALITGGAKRIGAAIAKRLHEDGYDILLHYGKSENEAKALAAELNEQRPQSCHVYSCALDAQSVNGLAQWALSFSQPLHVLVNNASQFYPTPWGKATQEDWQQLMGTNVQVPFFLTQALLPELAKHQGCVINIIDIHSERSLEEHPIYSASKAALKSLTQSLAKDLGNKVRCNGVSPGAILWPDQELSAVSKQTSFDRVPQQRLGSVENIAQTVSFICANDYLNGQVINVDGGRTVYS